MNPTGTNTGTQNSGLNPNGTPAVGIGAQQPAPSAGLNPNGTSAVGTGATPPPVSSTMNASALNTQASGGSTASVSFPTTPQASTAPNATINSIPDPTNAAYAGADKTEAQGQVLSSSIQSTLQRIAGMGGTVDSQGNVDTTGAVLPAQDQAAQQLGFKNYGDLTGQIAQINSQVQALKDQANMIPIQDQQDAQGRGITSAGLAPEDAAKIRNNTIKALGLSSVASVLQGDMTSAQTMANNAVTEAFAPLKAQLSYQQQLYNMNQDTLKQEDTKAAAQLQASLADRTAALTRQEDNAKSGQAIIASVTAANRGNPGALMAVSNAAKLDPTDPNYLINLQSALGQYTSLSDQQALATLKSTQADAALKNEQTQALIQAGDGGTIASQNQQTTSSGITYVDGSNLTGKDLASAQAAAAKAGVPFVSKTDAPIIQNVQIARSNLAGMQAALANLSPGDSFAGIGRALAGLNYAGESITQHGPQATDLATYNDWKTGMVTAFKAMSGAGTSGARGAVLVQQLMDAIPTPTDTKQIATEKFNTMNKLLDSSENGILGLTQMTGPDNKTYNVPNNQVAAFRAAGGH